MRIPRCEVCGAKLEPKRLRIPPFSQYAWFCRVHGVQQYNDRLETGICEQEDPK